MESPNRRQQVNCFDVPEIMPGAKPGARNVQRDQFERQCKRNWRQDIAQDEEIDNAISSQAAVEAELALETTIQGLVAAFPVDEALVREIYFGCGMCSSRTAEKLLQLCYDEENVVPPKACANPKDNQEWPTLAVDGWEMVPEEQPIVVNVDSYADKAAKPGSPDRRVHGGPLIKPKEKVMRVEKEKFHDDLAGLDIEYNLRKYAGERRARRIHSKQRVRARSLTEETTPSSTDTVPEE